MCALIKFGAGVSEMRGKEGGVIYSRNAAGAYVKAKVSPVNPQTGYQQAVRAHLLYVSQLWNTLGDAAKAAWDTLGEQVTRINRFGDAMTYTGFNLFMRLNLNLLSIGQAAITAAPAVPSNPTLALGVLTLSAGTPTGTLAYIAVPNLTGKTMVLYGTGNIFTGRTFVKNFRRLFYYESEPTSPIDFESAWESRFGSPAEGAKVYIAAKVVDEDTGFDTAIVTKSGVWAA